MRSVGDERPVVEDHLRIAELANDQRVAAHFLVGRQIELAVAVTIADLETRIGACVAF